MSIFGMFLFVAFLECARRLRNDLAITIKALTFGIQSQQRVWLFKGHVIVIISRKYCNHFKQIK